MHIFRGEPLWLRRPVSMKSWFCTSRQSGAISAFVRASHLSGCCGCGRTPAAMHICAGDPIQQDRFCSNECFSVIFPHGSPQKKQNKAENENSYLGWVQVLSCGERRGERCVCSLGCTRNAACTAVVPVCRTTLMGWTNGSKGRPVQSSSKAMVDEEIWLFATLRPFHMARIYIFILDYFIYVSWFISST